MMLILVGICDDCMSDVLKVRCRYALTSEVLRSTLLALQGAVMRGITLAKAMLREVL